MDKHGGNDVDWNGTCRLLFFLFERLKFDDFHMFLISNKVPDYKSARTNLNVEELFFFIAREVKESLCETMVIWSESSSRPRFNKENEVGDEDRISKLPHELKIYIVSMLPAEVASRMSFLSKSWKDIWVFLPNLHVVMPRCIPTDDFNSFVDRIMILRENPRLPIEKFSLSYHRSCHNNNISRCIRAAAKLDAKEVEITLP
ncbi:hypothetical protein L2E82_28435 [Cichorium intybus]|uniref:Uncharacterized protein n=1 Tax=Cichorium intybus TaxID=13427 RepID=A0ACB9CVT8_CICIN|nr:hypothetical protein L2E82_28435 [Cichorium intybus]